MARLAESIATEIGDLLEKKGYEFSHTEWGYDGHYYGSRSDLDILFDKKESEFAVFKRTAEKESFVDFKERLDGDDVTLLKAEALLNKYSE